MSEFTTPKFLENQTFEEILDRMIEELPEDLDVSEGSHPYNLLAPTAMQMEYFAGYLMMEAIKLIFPKYSSGNYEIANLHAAAIGERRKDAVKATGELKILGKPGTILPYKSPFLTASTDDSPTVQFNSLGELTTGADGKDILAQGDVVIGPSGEMRIGIEAEEAGVSGNVAAGAIKFYDGDVEGITFEHTIATKDGSDEESTEKLLERIVEKEANLDISFVGCLADYKRWAEQVKGVGSAAVEEAKDGSGKVKIAITTTQGDIAPASLLEAVREHIMGPDDQPIKRLAPVNATLEVVSARKVGIYITAQVYLEGEANIVTVQEEYLSHIKTYVNQIMNGDRIIKYSKVAALLSGISGVSDFKNLRIGRSVNSTGTDNIAIANSEIPEINDVSLTKA